MGNSGMSESVFDCIKELPAKHKNLAIFFMTYLCMVSYGDLDETEDSELPIFQNGELIITNVAQLCRNIGFTTSTATHLLETIDYLENVGMIKIRRFLNDKQKLILGVSIILNFQHIPKYLDEWKLVN